MTQTRTQNTPAPEFTLCDVASILHSHVHSKPQLATAAQSHALNKLWDQINNVSTELDQISNGLDMFLQMLESSAADLGMQELHAKQITGVLLPTQQALMRHADTLRAALAKPVH